MVVEVVGEAGPRTTIKAQEVEIDKEATETEAIDPMEIPTNEPDTSLAQQMQQHLTYQYLRVLEVGAALVIA